MTKDTRRRIVEAAMELFWLKGFGSTSISDIFSRSQVNSGSLYYFFPGKQDVLIAVLEAYRDGIGAMLLQPAWAGIADPVERIVRTARRATAGRFSRADCTYGCPIGSLALELHEPDPPVRELMAANFRGLDRARSRSNCSLRSRPLPLSHRFPGARRAGAQRHGGRRHAGADFP